MPDLQHQWRWSDWGAVPAAGVASEAGSLGALESDAARLVARLGHIEIESADRPMSGPGQSHHSGQPRQGPGVPCADAAGGQQQPAHCPTQSSPRMSVIICLE